MYIRRKHRWNLINKRKMKKIFSRYCLIAQVIFAFSFALIAADSIEIENIEFHNKYQQKFTLMPVHKLEEEKFSQGYFELMSNKNVYQYYEGGVAKTIEECRKKYKNISQQFVNWHGDQLGWVAIVDESQNFQGFVGAYIDNDSIEVCVALNPWLHQQKIAANALKSFFQYFFGRASKMM